MEIKEELALVRAQLERLESQVGIRPDPIPRHPPYFGLTPVSGLHHLKDGWYQVKYMAQQCAWLRTELDAALEATRVLAPDRPGKKKDFRLRQRLLQEKPKNIDERMLEWKIFDQDRLGRAEETAAHPFWNRLVSFQVPLYDNTLRDGWDKIDLLGITHQGMPVVIELKKETSSEKPLRPLLEAAAYAIALRKVWNGFFEELAPIVAEHNPSLAVQQEPVCFHILVLAPAKYWQRLLTCKDITSERWNRFADLAVALGEHGYPASFAQVEDSQDRLHFSKVSIPHL